MCHVHRNNWVYVLAHRCVLGPRLHTHVTLATTIPDHVPEFHGGGLVFCSAKFTAGFCGRTERPLGFSTALSVIRRWRLIRTFSSPSLPMTGAANDHLSSDSAARQGKDLKVRSLSVELGLLPTDTAHWKDLKDKSLLVMFDCLPSDTTTFQRKLRKEQIILVMLGLPASDRATLQRELLTDKSLMVTLVFCHQTTATLQRKVFKDKSLLAMFSKRKCDARCPWDTRCAPVAQCRSLRDAVNLGSVTRSCPPVRFVFCTVVLCFLLDI